MPVNLNNTGSSGFQPPSGSNVSRMTVSEYNKQNQGTWSPDTKVAFSYGGKTYMLNDQQYNWVKSRWQNDNAGTYGYDVEDQKRKAAGQMSSTVYNSYKGGIDEQLRDLGLPSIKKLDSYLEGYQKWHTGGMDQYFGQMNLPKNYWTNVKGWYQSDMQNAYENTAEDQQRKARGLMPSKWESKYTDTEIDDQLRARGLPPISEFNTYANRYNNYQGIENFYANVALADTNLRLQGVNDDDKEYEIKDPQTGEVIKKGIGKDLYAESFHNELKKTNEDGSYVYAPIMSMFQNRAKPSSATPSGDYAYDLGAEIVAANKEAASDDDYANYNAFSYDDYKSKYDDLYNRYFAGQTLSNGQTVNDALTVKAREEDAEALRDYFKFGAKEPAKFTAQYFAEHPDATPETMFLDMEANNVTDTEAYEVYETMKKEAKGTSAWYDVVNGWSKTYGGVWSNVNESDAPIPDTAKPLTDEQRDAQAEKDRVKAAQQYGRAIMNGDDAALNNATERANVLGYNSPDDMVAALKENKSDEFVQAVKDAIAVYESAMAAYEDTYPGYGAPSPESREPIDKATAALNALGFKSVHDATRYVGGAREADPQKFVRENTAAMNDYVDNAPAPSEEAVTTARNAIEAALIDDNGPLYSSVDAVIRVLDGIAENSANAAAYWQALEDLGFTDLSGMADDLTADWSDADKRKLKYHLGGNNFLEMTDGEDSANNDWSAVGSAQYSQQLNSDKFSRSLEWVLQQVNAGKMTEADGYQLLAANGFQNEMEEYMGDEWHKAHFVENTAPGLYAQAEETDRLLWEEMTSEEQRAAAEDLWNDLSDEQKASMYGKDWWKFDPTVYRTFGQALEQQLQAVLPGLGAEIISTPVKVLDAIEANLSGRPDMWKTTQNLMAFQQKMGNLGAVADNVNGAGVAQTAADVVQEIGRMYFYGSIGGAIGAGFAGTKAGAAILAGSASNSAVVRGASKMFMSMVKSSPFMVSAFANNYSEVKALGASNSEATWFGLITGLTEGILEGFEFDELWGKTINGDKFAQQLLAGAKGFQRMGIVGKARVASMVVSGLGEFTEESIGYVVETALKMRHSDTWGKGTEWSANDWLDQAMMGFLTGALGGGLHSIGSITADSLIKDYAMHDEATFRAVFPDLVEAVGRTENLPEATRRMYEKGGATVLSADALQEVNDQIKKCDDGIANAPLVIKGIEDKAQKKIDSAYEEVRKYDAKLAPYASMDTLSGEDALIFSDLIDKRAAAQRRFEAESKAIQSEADEQIEQAKNALKGAQDQKAILEKKVQEHWAGVYFSNKAAIIDGLTDEIVTNLANSYQNGSRYEAADLTGAAAEGAELVRKGANNPAQTKLAEAEATETIEEAKETAEAPENAAVKARELAYDRVYKDHEAGKAYAEEGGKSDSKLTPVQFAEEERQNFQAKTTARLRRVTLELAGLEAKEGMSAKEIFDEAKKAMTPEAAQKLDMYQKLSKALGLNMVVRDVVAGTSGYVHDGKLYVTLNGKQSMLRVAAHELTHYMKGHAETQYDALRTSLVNEVGQEKFDELLAEKAQEYGLDLNDAKARLEADDEVCAELCEKMLENPDALERFVQSDLDAAKTLKQRLAKTLVAIKSAIRSIGTSDAQTKADLIKQQDTIEQWYKGLSDAIDNANKAGKTTATTEAETATVADTTTEAPQAPPVDTNPDLFMGEESARREQLRSDLEALAKKGTRVKGLSYQEVNDVLDRVILGDKANYSKADYAQIRGMLAQLIPEVQAMVNGGESVDVDALNERVTAALDYMLERYGEGSEDYYGLRDLIPNKIALTDTAYKDLRAKDMTLRQASNELTKALSGKFVNFVYKKAPSYNNAMTIDELWQTITDQYGEQNGVGNIGEDALALIDYVRERADNRTSFNDLYGSQREDMVNTQVGEFLDAVQSMVEGKNARKAALHKIDDDYNVTESAETGKTASFSDSRIDDLLSYYGAPSTPTYSKAYAAYISPADFISLTATMPELIAQDARPLDVDELAGHQEMYLRFDPKTGEVTGHEGRHRMQALMNDGFDNVAIVLIPKGESGRYNRTEISSLRLTGQEFSGNKSPGDVTISNLVPVSYKYADRLRSTFEGGDIRYSIDDDYMPLAEKYDAGIATDEEKAEMRSELDEAAKDAGYRLKGFHGTNATFTVFDPDKRGSKNFNAPSAYMGFFASKSKATAESYTGLNSADVFSLALGGESAQEMERIKERNNFTEVTKAYDEAREQFENEYKAAHGYKEQVTDNIDAIAEKSKELGLWDADSEKNILGNLRTSLEYDWNTKHLNDMNRAWEQTQTHKDYQAFNDALFDEWSASEIKRRGYTPHVKELYIKMDNPFVYDFHGEERDTESFAARMAQAKKNGHDGCIFLNVADGADIDDIYAVFDNKQFKSADLVTYDDDNNIIPLSERFNPNKTDIRFTVDDDLDDLINRYGAIEQGREPRARDVQVPRQVDDQTRVSKLIRSGLESATMTDATAEEVKGELVSDIEEIRRRYSYIPKSNDETLRKARDYISRVGISEARRVLHNDSISGNFNLNMEAVGMQLLWDAAERGDQQAVKELYIDLRPYATEAGQRAQLFNMLKEMKGVGSAWYVENLVKDLNTKYADDIATGAIDGPITVSEDAMNQLRAAKTQAEVDAAEGVVATELAAQLPLTWDEKLSNWRYLSMLGNPITHVRNFTGNKLMYGMGGMKDVAAASLQRILENTGITNESDRAHALLTNADWKYWNDFVQKSYEEQRSNLQGGGKLGFQSLLQQNKRSFDNKVLDAIARGKNPGVVSEKGRVAGLFENIKNNGAMGMLEVADAWGLEDNYKRALTEYMKAQGYSLKDGKVGKTGKDGTFTEISPEAMNKAIEWASGQAWTNTFRGPSKLATELNKISKMNPVAKLVVEGVLPFKKTPFNIAKQGFWYSPAGLVTGTVELLTKVKQGKMSAATAIDHMASGLTGTALMALGVVLAKAGILRGGGDDKKKLETYLEDTGDQTYAFKFGNVSINMSAIAPATIPLFMGVALQEMLSRNGEDDGVDLSTITDVLAGTLNPFMEMSFMSSLNSALKNYNNEGIGGALGSTIMTAAQNYGSQYLPTLGGKVAQFIDPTQRTTKSSATSPVGGNMDYYWRSLVKKVPGAEATLQPDVNIWGQTTTKDSFGDWALDFANKFILPTNIKVTNRDAVDNELIRVVESTGIVDFLPSDGAKYFKVKGETYKMNASQYTEYSKERGQAAYAALKDVMAGASYKTATDEQKAELLKKALDNAYKSVNNVWKEKLGAYDK